MANFILFLSIIGWLLIFVAVRSYRAKPLVIFQFVIGWWVIELAFFHMLLNIAIILMAVGDLGHWTFNTILGFALSAYNAFQCWVIHTQATQSKTLFEQGFSKLTAQNSQYPSIAHRLQLAYQGISENQWLKPFSYHANFSKAHKNIPYGDDKRQRLTIYEPAEPCDTPMPIMLQIHGGGWTLGYSERQALPLRDKLTQAGWLFIAIDYRLSPEAKFPDHLVDCKKALLWIQENIEDYGGDPDFILTTGGSAGAHLASLLALTHDQEKQLLQPDFTDKTLPSIKGCVPLYGVYDFLDESGLRDRVPMKPFLEKTVMQTPPEDPLWELASPIKQLKQDRPPFMVIHGELDTLAFVEEARAFVQQASASSESPCYYFELPQTQHAFDLWYSPHAIATIQAIHYFCEHLYTQYIHDQITD
ncbi:MAG: alpha/beta hydrolase [Cellvibrionales bacterium]|nr:alpha/beta hydrolase [Cellvibrionales bacterium]